MNTVRQPDISTEKLLDAISTTNSVALDKTIIHINRKASFKDKSLGIGAINERMARALREIRSVLS